MSVGVASFGDQVSVEHLWRSYFKYPTDWGDGRDNHLHVKCPDFGPKCAKEAERIYSWNTPQRVNEAVERKTASEYQWNMCRWTSLISQYRKCGQDRQALKVYEEMQKARVKPSSYTFVAALQACSTLQDLESAKKIHAEVVASGFLSNVYVGTMLVEAYTKCGRLMDARCVFDQMPCRNEVSWNALILGYAQMDEGRGALDLYAQMQQEGVAPNDRTFVSVLKACAKLATQKEWTRGDGNSRKQFCLEQVKAIHSDAIKGGFELNVFVGNMLLDAYAKCGSLVDALQVFNRMPRCDVVSWNTLILGCAQMEKGIEALHLYGQMQQEGVVPDARTFVAVLKACSSLTALDSGNNGVGMMHKDYLQHVRAVHSDIVKDHCESDRFVGTMLVDAYARCGSLLEARSFFDRMPCRDVVAWNAMIFGYTQMEQGEMAFELYKLMLQEGTVPNERTFVGALKACSIMAVLEEKLEPDRKRMKMRCFDHVRAIHSHMSQSGFQPDGFVGNMLVDAYGKCGSLADARHVFETMPHRNQVSWNAIILAYAQMEVGHEALELYAQMQEAGLVPNERTFVGVLKAWSCLAQVEEGNVGAGKSAKKQCLEEVKAVHSQIVRSGCERDIFVGTMLVNVYAKCSSLADARHVFEKMPHRNVVSWNAMIMGYTLLEQGHDALHLYAQMQQEGVMPDEGTFVGALKACGVVLGLEKGKEIHAQLSSIGLDTSSSVMPACLIDMYAKCGSMMDAQQVFDASVMRGIVTWSALIAGYARHGDSEHVFDLFRKMRENGIQPNGVTLLSVLTVCSHVGLLDKGQECFEAMSQDFNISPTIEHYTCMIDLLGRSGQLDRALALAKTMPFEPDSFVWETVLCACQKWINPEVGRHAFECAIGLDRNHAVAYVLMANIYAAAQLWKDAREIHSMRVKTQSWKDAGQSWWTDMGGVIHAFVVGDQGHLESPHVHAKLLQLFLTLQEDGCDT